MVTTRTRCKAPIEMVAMLEHGIRSVVKIGAQPVLVGAWLVIGEVDLGCLWIGDEGGVG